MPDQRYEVVGVRSNVDRLSVTAVHRLFADLVYRSVHAGEDFMRMVVPKGESLRMERAISVDGPHDADPAIDTAVGIPPITEAPNRMSKIPSPDFFSPVPGGQTSADYPLFVDRGTGLFGSAHAPIHAHTGGALKFEDSAGNTIFRRSVAGQPASHFMLATYEEITRVSLPVEAERFAERVKHLYSDPVPAL